MRSNVHHWSPFGHWAADQNSLCVTKQLVLYPPIYRPIKSIPSSFESRMLKSLAVLERVRNCFNVKIFIFILVILNNHFTETALRLPQSYACLCRKQKAKIPTGTKTKIVIKSKSSHWPWIFFLKTAL